MHDDSNEFQQPCPSQCDDCLCWDRERLVKDGRCVSDSSALLPELGPNDPGGTLPKGPGRLDFKMCKEAWDLATERFCIRKNWESKHVKSYLGLLCLSDRTKNSHLESARRHFLSLEKENVHSPVWEDEDHRGEVVEESTQHPELHCRPPHPALWDLFEVDQLIETPMHNAMNCQKSVLVTAIKYFSTFGKGSQFCKSSAKLLEQVKSMALLEIRAMPFKDHKFGGFVAENYSAVMMLMPWVSQLFETRLLLPGPTSTDDLALPDPNQKPHNRWSMKENRRWLQLRGLTPPEGITKDALRDCVARKRQDKDCPEEIPDLEETNGVGTRPREQPPETLRQLFLLCHRMFQAMFSSKLSGAAGRNRLLARTKLFLSHWDKVDLMILPKRKKPIHIAKFNTLGLLRSCDTFLRFSLIRNMHEGGAMGEGIVKTLREKCPAVAKDNWSSNLVSAFYHSATLATLLRDMEDSRTAEPVGESEEEPVERKAGDEQHRPGNRQKKRRRLNRCFCEPFDPPKEGMATLRRLPSVSVHCRRCKAFASDGSTTCEHPGSLLRNGTPISFVAHRESNENLIVLAVATNRGFLNLRWDNATKCKDEHGFLCFHFWASEGIPALSHGGDTQLPGFNFLCSGTLLPWLLELPRGERRRFAAISNDWEWFDGRSFTE